MRGWSCSRSWSPAAARSVPRISSPFIYLFILSITFPYRTPDFSIEFQHRMLFKWKRKRVGVASIEFRFSYAPSPLFSLLSVVFLLLLMVLLPLLGAPCVCNSARALESKMLDPRCWDGVQRASPSSCPALSSRTQAQGVASFNAARSQNVAVPDYSGTVRGTRPYGACCVARRGSGGNGNGSTSLRTIKL